MLTTHRLACSSCVVALGLVAAPPVTAGTDHDASRQHLGRAPHTGALPPRSAAPTMTNGWPLRVLLEQARVRRIDLVASGDSNQSRLDYGWSGGLEEALFDIGFPMYATGLMCQNQMRPSGFGYDVPIVSEFRDGSRASAEGLPAPFDDLASPWQDEWQLIPFQNHVGCFAPAGLASGSLEASGLRLDGGEDVLGREGRLRFHLDRAAFTGEGDGGFVMEWLDDATNESLRSKAVVTEGAAREGMVLETLDLPPGPRSGALYARQAKRSEAVTWRGRAFTLYHRIENLDRRAGFSLHTWGTHPGESARYLANLLINDERVTEAYVNHFLERVQHLQDGDPIVIHVINHGFNDRGENQVPSVGPAGQAGLPYNSRNKKGYKDNLRGLMDRILEAHEAVGPPGARVHFLLMPSHRTGDGPEAHPLLEDYRVACHELARERPNVTFLNLAMLMTSREMEQRNFYADNHFHLRESGYRMLSRMAFETILTAPRPCPADLDGSGAVDFLDLLEVFTAWGPCPQRDCAADLDGDGAVGFLDMIAVLAAFGACADPAPMGR